MQTVLPIPLQKNDPLKKNIDFQGVKIGIEWPKGSIRKYENSTFRKYMYASYGYIKNTNSVDGEEVDVYVGDDKDSEKVFKITQLYDPAEGDDKKKPWTFDEYKYMLGFKSSKEAKSTYIKCMTKKHFGDIKELTIGQFKAMATRNITSNK